MKPDNPHPRVLELVALVCQGRPNQPLDEYDHRPVMQFDLPGGREVIAAQTCIDRIDIHTTSPIICDQENRAKAETCVFRLLYTGIAFVTATGTGENTCVLFWLMRPKEAAT